MVVNIFIGTTTVWGAAICLFFLVMFFSVVACKIWSDDVPEACALTIRQLRFRTTCTHTDDVEWWIFPTIKWSMNTCVEHCGFFFFCLCYICHCWFGFRRFKYYLFDDIPMKFHKPTIGLWISMYMLRGCCSLSRALCRREGKVERSFCWRREGRNKIYIGKGHG